MSKCFFYARLAAQSIKKNGRFYLPYIFTCIGAVAMFYIMMYLSGNEGLNSLRGTEYVTSFLLIGVIVIALFSAVVLFYTNSFLIKRRLRELGLYNILGMSKLQIGRVMLWETLYIAVISLIGGLLAGVLLSKLTLLILCRLTRFATPFGFGISLPGIQASIVVFCIIFAINLLTNLLRVGKSQPIELLRSTHTAEKEPKSKWPLTVLGLLTLGAGYAIALRVESPVTALALFFVAVTLVIIGTYCLFISGSIVVLKLLRRNKRYYYQTRHFISVSGMLHRMKRNAAGLASICILSTMVLITVSTTLSLYLGGEDSLDTLYPHDIIVTYGNAEPDTVDNAVAAIKTQASEQGVELTQVSTVSALEFAVSVDGNTMQPESSYSAVDGAMAIVSFMPQDEYTRRTGEKISLTSGETLAMAAKNTIDIPAHFTLAGQEFTVREYIDNGDLLGRLNSYVAQTFIFVVNESDLTLLKASLDAAGENIALETMIFVDLAADEETQLDFYYSLQEVIPAAGGVYDYEQSSGRAVDSADFYAMYGGFFFIGIFLGLMFLMATALLIYYKQLSEGYEDVDRFRIMQQVGLSQRDVRRSIRSQILVVFTLPLLAAAIHIVAAFRMVTRLMIIFSLYNTTLFALCCLGTFAVFALVYVLICSATAKAYYRVVRK